MTLIFNQWPWKSKSLLISCKFGQNLLRVIKGTKNLKSKEHNPGTKIRHCNAWLLLVSFNNTCFAQCSLIQPQRSNPEQLKTPFKLEYTLNLTAIRHLTQDYNLSRIEVVPFWHNSWIVIIKVNLSLPFRYGNLWYNFTEINFLLLKLSSRHSEDDSCH